MRTSVSANVVRYRCFARFATFEASLSCHRIFQIDPAYIIRACTAARTLTDFERYRSTSRTGETTALENYKRSSNSENSRAERKPAAVALYSSDRRLLSASSVSCKNHSRKTIHAPLIFYSRKKATRIGCRKTVVDGFNAMFIFTPLCVSCFTSLFHKKRIYYVYFQL